jgi:uncharacterized membrane protein YjfL (UPF0719 family)
MFLSETWCEDMSADENLLLVLSGVVGFAGVVKWAETNFGKVPGRKFCGRWVLNVSLAVGLGSLYYVLRAWADPEVRGSACYLSILMAWGIAGASLTSLVFPYLGVSVRWDCIGGRNLAAAWSLAGAIMGLLFIHCGSNIGRGPSLWNNVFSAMAGTVVWLALWFFLEWRTRVSLAVTEERDLGSGLRLGSFLCAEGLIMGSAVAGEWESMVGTMADLIRDGWFGLALVLPMIAFEKRLQPSRNTLFPSWIKNGLCPAVAYLAFGAFVVVLLRKWKTQL